MHSIAWWPSLGVLIVASGMDLRTRRIPNWLAVPFLISGLALQCVQGGWAGSERSMAGVALAVVLFGIPCFLKGMGLGDLKLAAGVGAWIGPGQFLIAFVMTGIAGGIIAVAYALWRGCLGDCLDQTNELLMHFAKSGARAHGDIRLGGRKEVSIPYAPAIAIGTLFSFFAR